MAEYIEILDSELEVRDAGTTGLFARLRDNAIAIAEGANGAPQIEEEALDSLVVTSTKLGSGAAISGSLGSLAVSESKLGSGCVDQSSLKTAYADTVLFLNNVAIGYGEYMFWPRPFVQDSATFRVVFAEGASNTTAEARLFMDRTAGGRYVSIRYVTASPPYDLGDGEIPLFLFIARKDGEILAISAAEDPPWAHQGPTKIHADFYHEGKPYQLRRKSPCTLKEAMDDPQLMVAYVHALSAGEVEAVEVTQAVKNADMPLFPHPWVGYLPDGSEVLMVDPVCEWLHDAAALHSSGQSVSRLIMEGLVTLGEEVQRNGPPGVKIVSARWSE